MVHCLQTGYFLQQRENIRYFYKAHNTPSPSKEEFSENDGDAKPSLEGKQGILRVV